MSSFQLSRQAEADLIEIGAYTSEVWGAMQTVRYLDGLEDACERLAEFPGLGRL